MQLCNRFDLTLKASPEDYRQKELVHANDFTDMVPKNIEYDGRLDFGLDVLLGLFFGLHNVLGVKFVVVLLTAKIRDLVNFIRALCLGNGFHVKALVQHALNFLEHICVLFKHVLYIVLSFAFGLRYRLPVFLQSKVTVDEHKSPLHFFAYLGQLGYPLGCLLLNQPIGKASVVLLYQLTEVLGRRQSVGLLLLGLTLGSICSEIRHRWLGGRTDHSRLDLRWNAGVLVIPRLHFGWRRAALFSSWRK